MYLESTSIYEVLNNFVNEFLALEIDLINVVDCLTNTYLLFTNNNAFFPKESDLKLMLMHVICNIYSYDSFMSMDEMIKSRITYSLQSDYLVDDIYICYAKGGYCSIDDEAVEFYKNNKIYFAHANFIMNDIDRVIREMSISEKQTNLIKNSFYKHNVSHENNLMRYNHPVKFKTKEYNIIKEKISLIIG